MFAKAAAHMYSNILLISIDFWPSYEKMILEKKKIGF